MGPIPFIMYVNDLPDSVQSYTWVFLQMTQNCIIQSVYQKTPQFYRMTLTQFCNGVAHGYPFLTFLNAIIAPSVILTPTLSIFSPLKIMRCQLEFQLF